jgi:hypothetical protein
VIVFEGVPLTASRSEELVLVEEKGGNDKKKKKVNLSHSLDSFPKFSKQPVNRLRLNKLTSFFRASILPLHQRFRINLMHSMQIKRKRRRKRRRARREVIRQQMERYFQS